MRVENTFYGGLKKISLHLICNNNNIQRHLPSSMVNTKINYYIVLSTFCCVYTQNTGI